MSRYECTVYDSEGTRRVLSLEGQTKEAIIKELLDSGLSVATVKEIKPSWRAGFGGSEQLSVDQQEFLTAQLSLLLKNGLRIDESLSLLQRTVVDTQLKFVVGELAARVREGIPLSEALLAKWGFSPLYRSLVKIGETSGAMDEVFLGISTDLKFKKATLSKIKQAVSYPLLVLTFCIAAILFIFNVVIPRMSVLFENQEQLPWYTHAMLATADAVVSYQWALIPLVLAFPLLTLQGYRNPRVKLFLDGALLRLPVVSTFIRLLERIRYSSAMELTVSRGISVERAMQYAAAVLNNTILQEQARSVRVKVEQGSTLAEAFRQTLLFDELHTGLIEVGERSGDLAPVFHEITDREQQTFDNLVLRVTTLLEPILILIMSVVTGGVVIVMLMSIIAVQDISF